jgi:hypothetical protein
VHQFSFARAPTNVRDPSALVADVQATSANLVQYFIRMGIDPELFAESATDRSRRIRVLSPDQLKKWRVTTEAAPIVTWSLDQTDDILYLRGSREEGSKKETIAVGCKNDGLFLFGYFAANDIGATISSDALILGTERFAISDRRAKQQWSSDALVVTYNLGSSYWERLRTAQNLGATIRSSTSAGYAGTVLPLEATKRDTFLRRCATSASRQ